MEQNNEGWWRSWLAQSKSKRVPLRKKYKIIRKVKEHHKKKAKEAKKLGFDKKPKVEKDPGIPNDWPFKEQELKALEARRQRAIQELEEKKAARKERLVHLFRLKRKLGLLEDEEMKEHSPAGEERVTEDSTPTTRNRDHSERAFYKELVKVVEASDVILEVLDARDPLGTRCGDMEKMVMKSGADKHLVLLLNKIDLVPREAVEKWLKYLREELPTVAFKCSTQEQRSNLGWKSGSKAGKTGKASKGNDLLQTSDCLGAETLIKLLKNYSRATSSLINSLKRSHVVNVGSTPGLTRSMQEVQLDKSVKLLDCPGVVMLKSAESDASVALRNCKRIEKLDDPVGPVKEILKLSRQSIGKIPYYTMPPTRNSEEPSEAKIVTELGKEFDVNEVYGGESSFIGSLKSVNDFNPVEVPSSTPLNFDMTMLEGDGQPQALNQGKSDDQPMESNEDVALEEEKFSSSTRKQNEKLYAEEGMLNTKLRKAAKKRQRKENQPAAMEHDSNDDYDFKVDYVKRDSAMDTGDDEDDVADKSSKNRFELPSGVEVDNE
ncbi:UNVERIFIED_CONTAM: Guanine nucleotide-binding protein-like NSN1 [Sesamum calycinum]|uniref:Guanine nucleotide-binding protein-like NSN1 n=1 Tax=Sesamum calycinum TaxID=2727403 RepID=A0AAW2RU60_9LAMI